jgi:FMN phosphatase YigB (HAD superfamily)
MPIYYNDASEVPLAKGRSLLIVDADEVLLRFVDGFDKFLSCRGFYFDFVSYQLHGNVRRQDDRAVVPEEDVTRLLDAFREVFDSLEAVEGAVAAIAELSPLLDIVALSNMTPSQAPPRLRNFETLGLTIPLMINSGPKGPAIKALAAQATRPVFFVDDIPQHLASAAKEAPEVFRIHLIGDERLRPFAPVSQHAHLRAGTWSDAVAFIREQLAAGDR